MATRLCRSRPSQGWWLASQPGPRRITRPDAELGATVSCSARSKPIASQMPGARGCEQTECGAERRENDCGKVHWSRNIASAKTWTATSTAFPASLQRWCIPPKLFAAAVVVRLSWPVATDKQRCATVPKDPETSCACNRGGARRVKLSCQQDLTFRHLAILCN